MKQNSFIKKLKKKHEAVKHYICLGLDPDPEKLPDKFTKDLKGCENFLEIVIKETNEHVLAYKPNTAFFEAFGIEGIKLLEKVRKWISEDTPYIIDAKRGDIVNTSKKLATYIYDYLGADATTLHPYMGSDSLEPFFEYKDKFNFVLALTSNPSAQEIEKIETINKIKLYEQIINKCEEWNNTYQNVGVVVGATQEKEIEDIRKKNKNLLFLMPGVGSQGGDYYKILEKSKNREKIVIINISRGLLYCSKSDNFAENMIKRINTFRI